MSKGINIGYVSKNQNSAIKKFDFSKIINKEISFSGKILGDKKKEEFYHELGILFSAGVDIKSSLELIEEEQTKLKYKNLFSIIKNKVVAGYSLSEAIRESGCFSNYEYYSIQIGEETGKLPIVLKELASFYLNKIKQSRQIVSALSYPALVMATSLGAIFFMMNFIVPMFADIFKRFGGDLPWITSFILQISNTISSYFYVFIVFLIIASFIVISQKNKLWFRNFMSVFILSIPFIGEMVRKIYLARFCHSMTLLISSKIPLIRSLSLVKQMIEFYPLEVSLAKIEQDILHGETLHSSMSKFNVYHKRMVSLIKVGEEVNQLEMFFEKIGKQYTEDVEHQTGIISSLMEPLMIIFLGLIVGVILIAMYLPLFKLSSNFG
ncbi:MAG: type II secretion system F family protein [Opitutaceae bacterium]|nr:type II secretion system F family protein [Cytophagales bacterium]